jgi:endonuclease/exonuclease/phosphatase (EEP) superfamily protein YafD
VELEDVPKAVMERTQAQNRQAQLLLDEAKRHNGVVILGCDCNSRETSSSHRMLSKEMNNAARVVGWLFAKDEPANTKPDTSLQHIDIIFYQGPVEPTNVYAIQDKGGSDHFPILAIFGLE